MKKVLFTLVLLVVAVAVNAQSYTERQTAFYVSEATSEFNLNEDQQAELLEVRTDFVNKYLDVVEKFNSGSITPDEHAAQLHEVSKEFHNSLVQITGKSYQELEPFLIRVRKEIKEVQ